MKPNAGYDDDIDDGTSKSRERTVKEDNLKKTIQIAKFNQQISKTQENFKMI